MGISNSKPDSKARENRLVWPQIRNRHEFKGRWVALDHCRYDASTAQPVEGMVVDADEDLVELCSRLQESDNKHCAIVFCEDTPEIEALSARPPTAMRPRSYSTH